MINANDLKGATQLTFEEFFELLKKLYDLEYGTAHIDVFSNWSKTVTTNVGRWGFNPCKEDSFIIDGETFFPDYEDLFYLTKKGTIIIFHASEEEIYYLYFFQKFTPIPTNWKELK